MSTPTITRDQLQRADVIVTACAHPLSRVIRWATDARVSHSILYWGFGDVIQADDGYVNIGTLDAALENKTLALAVRYAKGLTDRQRETILTFAEHQLGRRFNTLGLVGQAGLQAGAHLCPHIVVPQVTTQECKEIGARVGMSISTPGTYFCSELVFAAYQAAGIKVGSPHADRNTPNDFLVLHDFRLVGYLKG
jgi:hypothetical protein